MQPSPFSPDLFHFFRDLRENNRKEWFEANRDRYEQHVLEPSRVFVLAFRSRLREISPRFQAEPRVQGGSLFRIHTNRRFNPDRPPYKTHAGIQFRHQAAGDVHAPGFYLHLEPTWSGQGGQGGRDEDGGHEAGDGGAGATGGSFAGVGIWRPDRDALAAIRDAIVERPALWRAATRDDDGFQDHFRLGGDSLVRGPQGYDRDHPLIDDLKRKDFVAVAHVDEEEVVGDGFVERFAERCRAGAPFVRWLCQAVGVGF